MFFFSHLTSIFSFKWGASTILHVAIWNSKSGQVPSVLGIKEYPRPPQIPNQPPRRNKALLRDYPPRYLNNLLMRACFFLGWVGTLRGSSLGFPWQFSAADATVPPAPLFLKNFPKPVPGPPKNGSRKKGNRTYFQKFVQFFFSNLNFWLRSIARIYRRVQFLHVRAMQICLPWNLA